MNKSTIISFIVLAALAGTGYFILKSSSHDMEKVSTPDPTPTGKIYSGYVAGHITIGPFCPVERVDQPCKTPPEAYSSREVIVYENNGITIQEKDKIDSTGNYKIALSPGKYFVQIKPAGIGEGENKPVTIKANQTAVVNFDIDTGIR